MPLTTVSLLMRRESKEKVQSTQYSVPGIKNKFCWTLSFSSLSGGRVGPEKSLLLAPLKEHGIKTQTPRRQNCRSTVRRGKETHRSTAQKRQAHRARTHSFPCG